MDWVKVEELGEGVGEGKGEVGSDWKGVERVKGLGRKREEIELLSEKIWFWMNGGEFVEIEEGGVDELVKGVGG